MVRILRGRSEGLSLGNCRPQRTAESPSPAAPGGHSISRSAGFSRDHPGISRKRSPCGLLETQPATPPIRPQTFCTCSCPQMAQRPGAPAPMSSHPFSGSRPCRLSLVCTIAFRSVVRVSLRRHTRRYCQFPPAVVQKVCQSLSPRPGKKKKIQFFMAFRTIQPHTLYGSPDRRRIRNPRSVSQLRESDTVPSVGFFISKAAPK